MSEAGFYLAYALTVLGEERRRNTIGYWSNLAREAIAKGDAGYAGAWARNAAYLALKEMR
jgi:hypothetical protein